MPQRRIEGYAIISEDGMLADATRHIPELLVVEADQKFFHGNLDRAGVVVHGPFARRRPACQTASSSGVDPQHRGDRSRSETAEFAAVESARRLTRSGACGVAGAGRHARRDRWAGGERVFRPSAMTRFISHAPPMCGCRAAGRSFPPSVPTAHRKTCWRSTGRRPGPPRVLDAAREVALVTWQR